MPTKTWACASALAWGTCPRRRGHGTRDQPSPLPLNVFAGPKIPTCRAGLGREPSDGVSPPASPATPLQLGPSPLQLAQDPPEEPAVHPARDPAALARVERVGLGVLDVMRHLVQERVEQLLQGSSAELPVVRVDPDQPPGLVIAPEDAGRRPRVDVDLVVAEAGIDPIEPGAE